MRPIIGDFRATDACRAGSFAFLDPALSGKIAVLAVRGRLPENAVPFARSNRVTAAALLAAASCLADARADASRPGDDRIIGDDAWTFKLTPSHYVTSNARDATDLNLRTNHGPHALRIGHYRRGGEFEQTRAGYERTIALPFGQLIPSLQVASHGFAGGSLNAQIGDTRYALLGVGRTNRRDYYNLNFDPNDSIVYGVGTRLIPGSTIALFTVRDDRLRTGQVVTHLVRRLTPDDRQRWTLDLSSKHGRASADAEPVSGKAVSLTYEHGDVFVRLARDRKVNFTAEDQTRVSIGLRF